MVPDQDPGNALQSGRRSGLEARRILPLIGLTAALGLSCGTEASQGPRQAWAGVSARPAAAPPAALPFAYQSSRQDQAAASYPFQPQPDRPATYLSRNPAHDLEASLDSTGLRLRRIHDGAGHAFSVHLSRYGCANSPRAARPAAPRLSEANNRVEYVRDGVLEWYVNGPLGLEHGFTIDHDPGCGAAGKLVFSLALDGALEATLAGREAGARLELRAPAAPAQSPRLSYGGLSAVDADQRELPARLRLGERTLHLDVDAARARYPVTVDPTWTLQNILVDLEAGAPMDSFGCSVAISGDTAVIGACNKSIGSTMPQQGQAYVFVRKGTQWSLQAILVDSISGEAEDKFGSSVALGADIVLIGAPGKAVGTHAHQGAVYVFARTGTHWSLQNILADSATGMAGDGFGSAVALGAGVAVIGAKDKAVGPNAAQGQAYVFENWDTQWMQQAVLVDSTSGAAYDQFGFSVAINEATIVIGAPGQAGANFPQGRAYVFVGQGLEWPQQAILQDPQAGGLSGKFGYSVAVDVNTVLVGEPGMRVSGQSDQGQAIVFARSGTQWIQQVTLADLTFGRSGDAFGSSVALDGDTAIIGAPHKMADSNGHKGQAYAFQSGEMQWTQLAAVPPMFFGAEGDQIGSSVAMSGSTTIVGAPGCMVFANAQQGQAYVYDFSFTEAGNLLRGSACSSNADCSSTFCSDGVCCDTACGNSNPADCQACSSATGATEDGTCTFLPASLVCDLLSGQTCSGTSPQCPGGASGLDAGAGGGNQSSGFSCSMRGDRSEGPVANVVWFFGAVLFVLRRRASYQRRQVSR
jgi:hypothetical protein